MDGTHPVAISISTLNWVLATCIILYYGTEWTCVHLDTDYSFYQSSLASGGCSADELNTQYHPSLPCLYFGTFQRKVRVYFRVSVPSPAPPAAHRWLSLYWRPVPPGTGTSASSSPGTLWHSDGFAPVWPSGQFLQVCGHACQVSSLFQTPSVKHKNNLSVCLELLERIKLNMNFSTVPLPLACLAGWQPHYS